MRFVRAIGLGLLLVVASIGALALGEWLREARTAPTGNALAGQKSASPSPTAVAPTSRPLRSLALPPGYAAGGARVASDGRSLVVPTLDWKRLAMFEIPPNDAPLVLRGTTTPTGGDWLPDGSGYVMGVYLVPPPAPLNADGAVSTMKQQRFSVFERDGSLTPIGSGWMQSRPSPDSQWVPVVDDCCPATIRVLPRHGGASRLIVRQHKTQPLFILGWDPHGRILYSEGGRLFAADLGGVIDEIVAPVLPASTERSYSYVDRSPDGTTVVLQVSASGTPLTFALSRTRTVSINAFPHTNNWIGPHEILGSTKTKFVAIDTVTGAERDLPTTNKPYVDQSLVSSGPYLLWAADMTTTLHLNDTRTGGERVIDLGFRSGGSQRLDGGRFLLVRDDGLAILDAAAWFGTGPVAATTAPSP
jgi:hypothetical protein